MSFSFSELIIYLLPGFLGLWVFKRIIQENLDNRTESTQIAIALLLGISGLMMLYAVNIILDVEYFSVKALRLSDNLGDNVYFWTSYFVLCIFSLLSGAFWGYLNVKDLAPTRIFSRIVTSKLRLPEKVQSESSLRILINDLRYETELLLARIYQLSEGKENAIIGWISNYSDTEKQIALTRIELPYVISDINARLDVQPRQCCINYDSGIVIEIFEWDKGKSEKFYEDMRRKYRETVVNLP